MKQCYIFTSSSSVVHAGIIIY
uniref:Uncharacterized protein n=1 Tax=Arundo donax TaxID=35708 RepID=A0A0A9AHM0_ARUDO